MKTLFKFITVIELIISAMVCFALIAIYYVDGFPFNDKLFLISLAVFIHSIIAVAYIEEVEK